MLENNVVDDIVRFIEHAVFGAAQTHSPSLCPSLLFVNHNFNRNTAVSIAVTFTNLRACFISPFPPYILSSLPSRQVLPLSFGTWDMHLSYFTIAFNAQHIFYDAFGQMECNGMPRRFVSQLVSVEGREERGERAERGAESQIVYICE